MLLCWFGTNIAEYLNWFCDILNFVCDNISLENTHSASTLYPVFLAINTSPLKIDC